MTSGFGTSRDGGGVRKIRCDRDADDTRAPASRSLGEIVRPVISATSPESSTFSTTISLSGVWSPAVESLGVLVVWGYSILGSKCWDENPAPEKSTVERRARISASY